MKWSKRPVQWRNTPLVADAFERWKHPGYSLLNVVYEIYSERFNPAPGWHLRISLQSLRREARFHRMPDMLKILKWIARWPDNQLAEKIPGFEPLPEPCPEPLPEPCPEPDVNHGRSNHEPGAGHDSTWAESALNPDRIMLQLTRTHALIMIPNFLELCDYYTRQKADELASISKAASKSPRPSQSKSIINKDRDGPASDAIIGLMNQLAELSGRNGKQFNAGKFTAIAVSQSFHPAAIVETLTLLVKRWETVQTPWPWSRKTLKEKNGLTGSFDWMAHENERAVWLTIAGKQQAVKVTA